jgi:hypothetical protein
VKCTSFCNFCLEGPNHEYQRAKSGILPLLITHAILFGKHWRSFRPANCPTFKPSIRPTEQFTKWTTDRTAHYGSERTAVKPTFEPSIRPTEQFTKWTTDRTAHYGSKRTAVKPAFLNQSVGAAIITAISPAFIFCSERPTLSRTFDSHWPTI